VQIHDAGLAANVILVEDHADTRDALSRLLSALHYRVRSAATVSDARDLIQHGSFDLLIVDLTLPDGSGFEVLAAMKLRHPHARSISLSGYEADADIEEPLDGSFDMHLTKPVDMASLNNALQSLHS
jgi:CheY-like chemotaxis protein